MINKRRSKRISIFFAVILSLTAGLFNAVWAADHLHMAARDTSQIREWIRMADNLKYQPDAALPLYFNAYYLADSLEQYGFAALCSKYIGTEYYYKSNMDLAFIYWEKSKEIYAATGDLHGVASTTGNQGIVFEYRGDLLTALQYYKEALAIFEELQDNDGIAGMLGHLGILFEYQGNYPEALDYYQKALRINESSGNQMLVSSNLTNIGIIYKKLQDYERALEYNRAAQEINLKTNNTRSAALNYINTGIVYSLQKNYSEALNNYDKALEINKELGNQLIQASIMHNIGTVHEYREAYDKALDYFLEAKRINESTGNSEGLISNLINIAHLYLQTNDYDRSITNASLALELAEQSGDISLQLSACEHLSEAFLGNRDYREALKFKDRWIILNDSLFRLEKAKAIADLEIRYETENKDREIEYLTKDNEIQKLQLEQNKQRIRAQRILFATLFLVLLVISLLIWLIFSNYKKQQTIDRQHLNYQKVITEQKLLRSQMNPHFIYNSLNSVQSFISSGQTYDAEKYLAGFARLMRGILENSRSELVNLDKEIEVLQLYLALEQLRFENRFSCRIEVEEACETEFISLPPMLIQPFVENAIIHGFSNKKEGELSISFRENDNYLICEVDDNGIGRKASAQMAKNKRHNSLATAITVERLNMLTAELSRPAFFHIEDKTDPLTGEALGTRVSIHIPITDN